MFTIFERKHDGWESRMGFDRCDLLFTLNLHSFIHQILHTVVYLWENIWPFVCLPTVCLL